MVKHTAFETKFEASTPGRGDRRAAGITTSSVPEPAPVRALRVNEAAARYGVSRYTIYKAIAEKMIPDVKLFGRRMIPVDALERLLQGEGA
jgi:excisionase family DNA binding protein